MKDTVRVTEDGSDRNLTRSVILIRDRSTRTEENLSRLFEDVFGTIFGHWDHALATGGCGGQVVLTGRTCSPPTPAPASARGQAPLLPQPGGQEGLPARGGVVVGQGLQLGDHQGVPGLAGDDEVRMVVRVVDVMMR